MYKTSIFKKSIDTLLDFILKVFTYPCWISIGFLIMCDKNFNIDYANYLSLIVAILYYLCARSHLAKRIVNAFVGKWGNRRSIQYELGLWNIILNNAIPLISIPITSLLISIMPTTVYNTNGLTLFANLLTVMTANIESC